MSDLHASPAKQEPFVRTHPMARASEASVACARHTSSADHSADAELWLDNPALVPKAAVEPGGPLSGWLQPLLRRRRVAQLQASFYAVGAIWTACTANQNLWTVPVGVPWLIRLIAAGMLGLWVARQQFKTSATALAAAFGGLESARLIWSLGAATLTWSVGVGVMLQMTFVGWWLTCLSERTNQPPLDAQLQPRPGRPLYL